ncbi:hypothetical protein BN1723_017828 [Verticillium longisporum]|uniref:Uncharacterized protein n=1 Tax=Verticillium longisporum TaxID=100787 RepID=A0A0G4LDI5_VERLO|nr:hypothetical protein BN1723_017828 [Verticillium longisporum]
MAKGKWIDKKSAQHFTLVHRPQNDPLINDENAPSMVFNPTPQRGETSTSVRSKTKHLDDLASEFGSDISGIRQNEGEAAEYGIYYDDSEYDYMQHMRDLNTGAGEAVWVEAEARKFQVYNLSVKFFYRWREIARKNRLHRRRVRDREEYKAALAEKFAAEAARKKKAKQVEAARLAALQRSKGIDPVDEFRNLLQMQKDKSQDHEDALWASGILAGIHDEREAIASIVRHHMPPPAAPTPKKWKKSLPPSNVSISRSESAKPGSAKTQALREKFSASTNNRSTSFRSSYVGAPLAVVETAVVATDNDDSPASSGFCTFF